jgi:hypothetical protein
MITGIGDTAAPHRTAGGSGISQENAWAFWQGVLVGVGTVVSTLGVFVLHHLFNPGHDS